MDTNTNSTRAQLLSRVRALIGHLPTYNFWIVGQFQPLLPKELIDECARMGFVGYTVLESSLENEIKQKSNEDVPVVPHWSRALTGYSEFRYRKGEMFADRKLKVDMIAFCKDRKTIYSTADPFCPPLDSVPDSSARDEIDEFVADLVLFTVPYKGAVSVTADDNILTQAGMRVPPGSLEAACALLSQQLPAMPTVCPTSVYRDMLRSALEDMPETQFNNLRHIFYTSRYPVKLEKIAKTDVYRPNCPKWSGLSPLLRTAEDVKKAPELAHVVYRADKFVDQVSQPKTTALQIQLVNGERAIRGEDSQKASFFASANDRGGFVEKKRRQICDFLSVALPLVDDERQRRVAKLEPSMIITVLPADSLVPDAVQAARDCGINTQDEVLLKFMTRSDDIQFKYPLETTDKYVRGSVLIDFEEGSIPSFQKGTSPDEAWSKQIHFQATGRSSFREFYLIRKIPPGLLPVEVTRIAKKQTAEGTSVQVATKHPLRTFKFRSAHAFAFLLTCATSVKKRYAIADDLMRLSHHNVNLDEVDEAGRRRAIFEDSRKRTFAVVNEDYTVDLSLNLWGRECRKLNKRDLRKLAMDLDDDDLEEDEDEIAMRRYLTEHGLAWTFEKEKEKEKPPPIIQTSLVVNRAISNDPPSPPPIEKDLGDGEVLQFAD